MLEKSYDCSRDSLRTNGAAGKKRDKQENNVITDPWAISSHRAEEVGVQEEGKCSGKESKKEEIGRQHPGILDMDTFS